MAKRQVVRDSHGLNAGDCGDARKGLLEDGRAAGQGLEATFVAAAAFGAIDVQDHVSDFPGGMVEAAVKVAVDEVRLGHVYNPVTAPLGPVRIKLVAVMVPQISG